MGYERESGSEPNSSDSISRGCACYIPHLVPAAGPGANLLTDKEKV
jgi:hypothetical protein